MYMKRSDRLWRKFLKDMRTDQLTAEDSFNDGQGGKYFPGEGLMPSQCPCYIPNVLPVPGLAGIQALEPGFTRICVQPYLPESMNELKCRYRSVSGMISVRVWRENGEVRKEIVVPEGVTCETE